MTSERNPFQKPCEALSALTDTFAEAYEKKGDKTRFIGSPREVIKAVKRVLEDCSGEVLSEALSVFNQAAEKRAAEIKEIEQCAKSEGRRQEEKYFLAVTAKYYSTYIYSSYAAGIAGNNMFSTFKVLPSEILAILELKRREKKVTAILVPVSGAVSAAALYFLIGWWALAAGAFTAAVGWTSMTLFSAVRTYLSKNLAEQHEILMKYFENSQYILGLFKEAHDALEDTAEGDGPIRETLDRIRNNESLGAEDLRSPLHLLLQKHDILFRFMNRMISTASMAAKANRIPDPCPGIFTSEVIEAVRPEGPGYPGSTSGN